MSILHIFKVSLPCRPNFLVLHYFFIQAFQTAKWNEIVTLSECFLRVDFGFEEIIHNIILASNKSPLNVHFVIFTITFDFKISFNC